MSFNLDKDSVDKLKLFIDVCKAKPEVLHLPEIRFFKNYIESFGGKIPDVKTMPSTEDSVGGDEPPTATTEPPAESDPDSDIEIDKEGCIDPEPENPDQVMGDPNKLEVSEDDSDKADELRMQALAEFSTGNFEKAVELFTEAIVLNPQSALLFAKRGQAYLKLLKPTACIKDCSKALELNCDSAAAYKFRGRAYRLIGEWENAAKDLRQACNIDFDEQTDEWLKEVTPNALKIEQHRLKQERKKFEREERERVERVRKAREAHAKAAQQQNETPFDAGTGGVPGLGDFYKLAQDPEVMAAFQDPEVAAAFQDIVSNPANFVKYQSNPKIMTLITKLSSKFGGGAFGAGGFPGAFPGGFAGAGAGANAPPPTNPAPEDDGLD